MSYQLKLTRPGGETRRLTFAARPSWLELESRIASLFNIQEGVVAVSYEDNDGDIVTMSSREELQDYFQTSYKHGQIAKFTVIDKTQSQRPARSAFVEDLDEQPDDGLPTMGPTMFVEVDDGGWQHLPRVREMFSIHEEDSRNAPGEGHAFVEVVDSDAEGSRKGNDPASGEYTSMNGINTRQSRYKGKQRVSAHSEATKSTSAASVVEDDFPTKPPVHVYDVSDIGRSPRSSIQGRVDQPSVGGPGVENFMGLFGTVYPANPPRDAFMHVPRAGETHGSSEHEPFRGSSSVGADSLQPGQIPSLDLEGPPLGPNGTGGSRTPTSERTPELQPSFVRDVADFVDNMMIAFAAHPELSEGIRNIVRNAVGGRYWNTERDRVTAVAENVKAAAEDTSARISQVAGDMANNAERDAVRMISEALGGVFRVIGELSGSEVGNQSANGPAPPVTRPLPPHPPPPPPPPPPMFRPPWPPMHRHHHPFSFPFGPGHRHGLHDAWNDRRRGWGSPHRPYPAPGQELSYRPPEPGTHGMDPSHLPWSDPMDYAQRDNTWGPGAYAPYCYGGPAYDNVDTEATQPNIHETKAHLETAKALYKLEKDRFRRKKEERRKQRHEIAERRAGQNRAQRADGTSREEEIIASIPFDGSVRGGPSKCGQTESPAIPPQTSGAMPSVKSATRVASAQAAQRTSSRDSVTSNPMHYAAGPVPPAPPVPPVPVPINIVPPAPPAPPIPPVRPSGVFYTVPMVPNIVPQSGHPVPPQAARAPSGPGPFSWPAPPARDPSRRAQLTTRRDRILTRLFDMGIQAPSQPDMMDIVNACTSRDESADDDEVLADILAAINIRSSPSPRFGNSGLPH